MEKFAKAFFSMRSMAIALFIFLIAIGLATFLEAQFDTETAKILVYNSLSFTLLLVYLCVCLIANIFRYNMFKREKIAVLMFHLSFIVMIVGAGITRYFSFEGLMIIKEGTAVNYIYSSDPYLTLKVNNGKMQYSADHQKYMSEVTNNDFSESFDFPNHKDQITVEYVRYQKDMVDSLVTNDSIQESSLEIVTEGMKSNFLEENGFLSLGDVALSYEKKDAMPGIQVWKEGAKLKMQSKLPMSFLAMSDMQKAARNGDSADTLFQEIPEDSIVSLQLATLYRVQDQQFVLKSIQKHTKMMRVHDATNDYATDYLTVRVVDGKKSREVSLPRRVIPFETVFELNGLVYEMGYGSKRIDLPFSVKCHDFQLERYPGSNTPSSFASELSILDDVNNYERRKRLSMNHVIDYQGYRFFQSSYEPDESGTHLSVNHDWWGTNISYLGYLMMGIGMILSLFSSSGRFIELNGLIRKSHEKQSKMMSILLALLLLTSFSQNVQAKDSTDVDEVGRHDHEHNHDGHDHETPASAPERDVTLELNFSVMTAEHSDELAGLLVQDYQGRFIPLHTFCDKLLRKISRQNTYKEYNAIQTVMSMHRFQSYWMNQEMIYISTKGGIRGKLGMTDSRTSFRNLLNRENQFKFANEYNEAHRKPEGNRNEFDKQVLKLGERFQLLVGVYSMAWDLIRALPIEGNPQNTWSPILDIKTNPVGVSVAVQYLTELDKAFDTGDYKIANKKLNALKEYQRKLAKDIIPEVSTVEMEIRYNKMNVFANVQYYYLGLGFLILLIFFFKVFVRPGARIESVFKRITQGISLLLACAFLYHGYGIYMRMMITGYAPWSNGYEAVVFIAWIALLTGLIFARKNTAILAGAAILAFFMIFVTEMNLMDPDISPMQPVLKSYWLMIHVAIITGSYAPLGLSCILGMLTMFLYIFRGKKNGKFVGLNISELTYVSEMTMTIGLFMLTIGTFLGGIWANESWGRYWGWDSKETWALVAVLTYAVILHLRYIPGLKDKFTFNVVALWGYASVLFTFFGVNFYLTGLHSYANGEAMGGLPDWLVTFTLVLYFITEFAALRNQIYIVKGRRVSLGYFKRKLAILLGLLLLVSIMMIYLKVSDAMYVVVGGLKIAALFIGTAAIQYGISYFVGEKEVVKSDLK
ncbi:cytochrome c biogenesis protein CcsA [Crocinitomicaceae bacterium]|nr:cytochrome c biogenesis protein CcsA [Crocinitomicaceae bacterium]